MAAGGVLVGRGYVSIRPEFEGDWSRSVNARASSAGRSGGGAFSKAFGAVVSGGMRGIVGGFGTTLAAGIAPAGAAVAALAPALATAGTAAGALKLGLSGVGEAFKAAFADSSSQASSAASATKAVESAQRGLANAQRSLAQARVDAAKRVADAQRGVVDAERDLADAQREAREVQGDLNDARREAARTLEDMNQRLAESHLDERDAVLRLKEAEKELKAAQAKPGTDPADLERLQLAYDRAALNLKEQQRDTKRLASDTAAANKAGIEGSEQVVAAKERISDANRGVADKERALGEAQRQVDEARADGQRQVEDAQRAVADAAAAVADAQSAAASQTNKFDEAMAKLAPNARAFVLAVGRLSPAWNAMKLDVQNALFRGLDGTVSTLAGATIPILQQRLTETAGIWNQIAKSAAGAVTDMARSGMLDQILKGANDNLAAFKDTPRQLITAFGQLTVAAQPAFNQLMVGFAGAIESATGRLSKAFESGGLKTALDVAFDILGQLGSILGDAFAVVGNILKAASEGGGQALAVVGELFAELRRISAMPEIQAAMRTIFASIAQIAAAIAPVIGSVVQAIVPLIAAVAPVIAQLAQALGPVLSQLATVLGAALTPIIEGLMPVVSLLGEAIIQIVQAVMPLLVPIGQLIGVMISSLMPVLKPVIDLVIDLVKVLVGPLNTIIQQFIPYIGLLGQVLSTVFAAITPLIQPIVSIVGHLAQIFADLYAQFIQTFMRVIVALLPVITQLVTIVVDLALQLITALMPSLDQIINAGLKLMDAVLPLLPMFASLAALLLGLAAKVLTVVLPPLISFTGWLVGKLAGAVSTVIGWVASLVTWLTKNLGPAFKWLNEKVVQPVWRAITGAIKGAWENGIKPAFNAGKNAINGVGKTFRDLRDKYVTPVWNGIKSTISGVWENGIKPAFDALKKAVGRVGDAFGSARNAIKTAWDKIKKIARDPIQYVVDIVYNKGIVGVWNKVATAFGADPLKEFHFARGGVMPGYTPGRDVHRFMSSSGMALELSGGEAIMRPEFTRAVGSGFVHSMNAIARSRGAQGVKAALAPVFGGNPSTPTDRTLRYADGGIFGWIKSAASKVAGAGSAVWNKVKDGAAWLKDTLAASARAGVRNVVDPLLKRFPGMDTMFGRAIRRIPDKIIDSLFGYSKEADKKGGGGIGGPRIQAALRWAKAQNGKPYIWGGVGPKGFDCSGLMGAIENVIRGLKPNSRRWATGAFHGKTAPPGWVRNGNSAFRVGITNAGVGHTAGTLGKTKVESRGGEGVVIGPRARGYNNSLFTSWYGFQPGKYDAGGFLQPGMTAAMNATGKPEAVLTSAQWRTMATAATTSAGLQSGDQLRLVVGDREFTAYVDDRADRRVQNGQRQLISVINAS